MIRKDFIAIADCIKGINAQQMTTAERKIADILIKLKIGRFDIYSQFQLVHGGANDTIRE